MDDDTDPSYPHLFDREEIRRKRNPKTGRRVDTHQPRILTQPNGHSYQTDFGCRLVANHHPVNPGRTPIPPAEPKDYLFDIQSGIKNGVSTAQSPFQPGDLVSEVSFEFHSPSFDSRSRTFPFCTVESLVLLSELQKVTISFDFFFTF